MDKEKHMELHKELHRSLDMLVADFLNHTGRLPSETTVLELMKWSNEQTINPSDYGGEEKEV